LIDQNQLWGVYCKIREYFEPVEAKDVSIVKRKHEEVESSEEKVRVIDKELPPED